MKLLKDVVLIRPFVICLLVMYHSFAMYGGKWVLPDQVNPIRFYWWIVNFLHSFQIETFVLISGYVYAYQCLVLKKNIMFSDTIKKKFSRLIIPCIFFGLIYYACFYSFKDINIPTFCITILSGIGHLWFLPMIFWCFIVAWFLQKIHMDWKVLLGLFCFGSIIGPLIPIPLGINMACQYFVYFYLGYILMQKREFIISRYCQSRFVLLYLVLFFTAYLFLTILNEKILWLKEQNTSVWYRLLFVEIYRISKLMIALMGSTFVYILANLFIKKYTGELSKWIYQANTASYGVYIYHQFFLMFIYYETILPAIINSYWLPWVGFVITICLSFLSVNLTLKTKIGKYLIG